MISPENLPRKLKNDSIQEATLEIRFDESAVAVAELFYGVFAKRDEWSSFSQARLPLADVPDPIRKNSPELRYQPLFELTSPDGATSIRFGSNTAILSRRGKYPGWTTGFSSELDGFVRHLFASTRELKIVRLGLRYINVLRSDLHGISGVSDLEMEVSVGGNAIFESINVNFQSEAGTEYETMSRIATIDQASGSIPENASVVIDIDVYSNVSGHRDSPQSINDWVENAHIQEKCAFFNVLGPTATERLKES